MKDTQFAIDAGAAAKFYHINWNNPVEFKDVLIHPGDFHGIMEFFSVAGTIVQGSGFEDIVYQGHFSLNDFHAWDAYHKQNSNE